MIVFLTSFPKCKSFSFVFSSVNENNYHSHSTSQMLIILIRIQLGKRKSFSFAFNFSNANHSHSYLHFRPPALPALMCESDNVSSKILREAARVCANPTIIYFYRPGVGVSMWEYVQIRQSFSWEQRAVCCGAAVGASLGEYVQIRQVFLEEG